jgi:HK97 family phage major capsid protein
MLVAWVTWPSSLGSNRGIDPATPSTSERTIMTRFKSLAFVAIAAFAAAAAFAAVDPVVATALAHAAFQSPEGLLMASFAPSVITRGISGAYERKEAGGDDDAAPAIIEIKRLIEDQGKAWKAFRDTNDALLKAKAEGKAVADLEAKLDAVSKDLDKLAEVKKQFDDLMLKLARPGGLGGADPKDAEAKAKELKGFNLALRAEFQSKGRAFPGELDQEAYAHYKSGFFKLAAGVTMDNLSSDERKAMSAGSDPDGGYLLPHSTQGRMITKLFEQSIMRQLADVQTITTEKIEGLVDDDETDAGWVSELGGRTGNDGTPQVRRYEIAAHEMYASPKISQKLIDDAATDVEGWLAGKNADKFGRVEGTAFWNGTGAGQPRGLATYTTVATSDDTRAWGQFEHVVTGANGAFHTTQFDPLHDIQGALKDHFLQAAQWCMRREVRTAARKLKESTTNRYLWEPGMQVGAPERLNGYPVRVDQYMPALGTGSLSLAFGDFRQAYTIVDRQGIRTLRDPYTAKPYVVFYSTKRTGGGAMNFEAIKFLKFST